MTLINNGIVFGSVVNVNVNTQLVIISLLSLAKHFQRRRYQSFKASSLSKVNMSTPGRKPAIIVEFNPQQKPRNDPTVLLRLLGSKQSHDSREAPTTNYSSDPLIALSSQSLPKTNWVQLSVETRPENYYVDFVDVMPVVLPHLKNPSANVPLRAVPRNTSWKRCPTARYYSSAPQRFTPESKTFSSRVPFETEFPPAECATGPLASFENSQKGANQVLDITGLTGHTRTALTSTSSIKKAALANSQRIWDQWRRTEMAIHNRKR
jgi:hypothetical protein